VVPPEVIHEHSHEAQLVGKAQQYCEAAGMQRHTVSVLCEVLDQLCGPAANNTLTSANNTLTSTWQLHNADSGDIGSKPAK